LYACSPRHSRCIMFSFHSIANDLRRHVLPGWYGTCTCLYEISTDCVPFPSFTYRYTNETNRKRNDDCSFSRWNLFERNTIATIKQLRNKVFQFRPKTSDNHSRHPISEFKFRLAEDDKDLVIVSRIIALGRASPRELFARYFRCNPFLQDKL